MSGLSLLWVRQSHVYLSLMEEAASSSLRGAAAGNGSWFMGVVCLRGFAVSQGTLARELGED